MASDRDDRLEGQDEEYHFSDEQMDYETDASSVPEEAAKPKPAGSFKDNLIEKFNANRRFVIGGVVVVILFFIVYKMLSPTGVTPSTDIVQAAPPKPISMTPPAQPKPVTTQTVTTTAPAAAPAVTPPAVTTTTVATQPAAPTTAPTVAPAAQDALKTVNDKIEGLAQKAEEDNAALQTRVQDLSTRIASIEAALTQISQLMQGTPTKTVVVTPKKVKIPRIMYSVQAIIPGRAWLKTVDGDTVTVAEGDTLKGSGKVVKIDPYDGVVDVDTGSGLISLTYGGGAS